MRILVIEHHEPVRTQVVEGLTKIGAAVDHTANGKDGLWYALKNEYDVIVTALMVPDIGGEEILQRLRKENSEAHVLILSAKNDVEDRVRMLNAGADDYVTKPFALDEVVARVQTLYRRRYGHGDSVLQVGNLKIDMSTQCVYRNEILIDLTMREYSLLVFLAMRKGDVVSRASIWQNIYQFESTVHSNVVDVYIGYLRKKIDRPGWPPLIHTRRGFGYFLAESKVDRRQLRATSAPAFVTPDAPE